MDIIEQIKPSSSGDGPRAAGQGNLEGHRQPAEAADRGSPTLAGTLGWLSLGIGLTELLAPGEVARMVGARGDRRTRRTVRVLGLRELASGLGILGTRRRRRWLWMRVGGDLLDLALLAAVAPARRRRSGRKVVAFSALTALTVLDAIAARRAGREGTTRTPWAGLATAPRTTKAVVTIRRPVDEVYAFWRDLENLPRVMAHVESIERIDDRRSHWTVAGPAGATLEWDAEITEDRPGESIAWRSVGDADIDSRGFVRFVPAPGERGTEVHAEITYRAPGGRVGAMIAKLFGREPGQQAHGDLRRLKQVLETGEIVHSDSSIHPLPHAARPPTERDLVRLGIEPAQGSEPAQSWQPSPLAYPTPTAFGEGSP